MLVRLSWPYLSYRVEKSGRPFAENRGGESNMAATASTTTVLAFSTLPFSNRVQWSYRSSTSTIAITKRRISFFGISTSRAISSPESVVVDEEAEERDASYSSDDEMPLEATDGSITSLTGCKACGREEIENGCNGEGRIQGGIGAVPGFGWWPIKAYRPCPAYLASGGRYKRSGQSMDDVVSGRGRESADGTAAGATSRKKKDGPRKFKR